MALLVLSVLCFLLSLATTVLGDPQPSQAQAEVQPLPSAPEGIGQTGIEIPTTAADPAVPPAEIPVSLSVAEAPKPKIAVISKPEQPLKPYVTTNQPKPKPQLSKPAPKPKIVTKVAELKQTDPGLISKIISATKGLIGRAVNWLGTRYIWGGISKRGVDCSGLTRLLYLSEGITLPHSARLQFKIGQAVARMALLPGDLVFFNTTGPISHVGMYIGNGEFLHAANPKRGVRVDSLDSGYYSKRFAGARRYKSFG